MTTFNPGAQTTIGNYSESLLQRVMNRVEGTVDSALDTLGERNYRRCNYVLSHIFGASLPRIERSIQTGIDRLLGDEPSTSQSTPLLFSETRRFNRGSTFQEKVKHHFNHLQKQSPTGICFSQGNITNELTGGICSAKSLEFASRYFKIKKQVASQQAKNPTKAAIIKNHLKKLETTFVAGSTTFRTRQMAFNTITCVPTAEDIDYGKNKVQALANFHNFAITHSSKELDVEDVTEKQLFSEMSSLPDGVFILRFTIPAYNKKLEVYGHTLIYIREEGLHLLYDPGEGLMDLSGLISETVLSKRFGDLFDLWNLEKARFYRIEERAVKHTIPSPKRELAPPRSRL